MPVVVQKRKTEKIKAVAAGAATRDPAKSVEADSMAVAARVTLENAFMKEKLETILGCHQAFC